jgi:glutamine synthetase
MLDASSVKTVDDARKIAKERGQTHVKVGLFDNDEILRGKYMSRKKFLSSLENGLVVK